MASVSALRETLEDLSRIEGKAELIKGRIVHHMPSGELPNLIALAIAANLRVFSKSTGLGHAYTDGVGYAVEKLASGRESFSPDASFHSGPRPENRMRFIDGAPTFAVEVRSENDYDAAAETAMAAKRVDYFEAGTQVVWDVDPLGQTVTSYRADAPATPLVFRKGDVAHAEPAVPDWRMAVTEIFED